jgi:hypothetical protein
MLAFLYKKKESRNRPGVAQRVPGGLGSQISWHSTHEGGEVVTLTHRPPLTPGRPWYGRKEYVTEKSNDTTGNRSRDHPTSSAAPYPLRHPRPRLFYITDEIIATSMGITCGISSTLQEIFVMNAILIYSSLSRIFEILPYFQRISCISYDFPWIMDAGYEHTLTFFCDYL